MNLDAEFNALVTLYQSVTVDMKQSYGVWENVGQRATKLSSALRTTAAALQGFVDAVQTATDLANNLKGASRDIGACITRVCMRQRALEGRLRGAADALSEQVSPTLQQKSSYWKARTLELEKLNGKQIKKSKGGKARADEGSVSEQRALCVRLLTEQRQQFSFFIETIMPFLSCEIDLIEEGAHLVPVVSAVDAQLHHTDSNTLVNTVISDAVNGGAEQAARVLAEVHAHGRGDSEDPSPTWSAASDVPSGSSDVIDNIAFGVSSVGVSTTCSGRNSTGTVSPPVFYVPQNDTRRTLSRRSSQASVFSKDRVLEAPPLSFRAPSQEPKQRPQSFGGELHNGQSRSAPSSQCTPVVCAAPPVSTLGRVFINEESSCSSETASSALIAETVQQIDQLGSDLENYCTAHDAKMNVLAGSRQAQVMPQIPRPTQLPPAAYNNPVRLRNTGSRPPPPERRGSQLSAGTPVPSIARSSLLGSRQSLNSTGPYGSLDSSQDMRFSNGSSYVAPHAKYTF